MTVWVLRQELTAEEEKNIFTQADVRLPFDNLPDLSHVASPLAARQLIKTLYPGEPPEAIGRRVERFWNHFSSLQVEDLVVVKLPTLNVAVIGSVSGKYHYEVGPGGSDIHLIPVTWNPKEIKLARFRHKEIFDASNPPLMEVTTPDVRVALRDYMPHSYNRFAKFKWLLVVFFLMTIIRMLHGMLQQL